MAGIDEWGSLQQLQGTAIVDNELRITAWDQDMHRANEYSILRFQPISPLEKL
jgi:hypothetical protein